VDSPLLQLCLLGIIAYLFHLWLSDLRSAKKGVVATGSFPGALPCSIQWILIGVAGALILVGGETLGESMLGLSSEQSSMTILFALVTVASGFGEELVFRGYLVITKKGNPVLWLGILGFSLLFAVVHPYLWRWENGGLEIQFTTKAWFSTGVVFLNSLWFYYLRFAKSNSNNSLWPCIAAHAASNGAVFFVKLAQGHVSGFY
jgi:hypothetical protein